MPYAEVLQEEALRESVTGCLLAVLADHTKSSKVQMWASYALYQQVSYNSEPIITLIYIQIILFFSIIASTGTGYWGYRKVSKYVASSFKRGTVLFAKSH